MPLFSSEGAVMNNNYHLAPCTVCHEPETQISADTQPCAIPNYAPVAISDLIHFGNHVH